MPGLGLGPGIWANWPWDVGLGAWDFGLGAWVSAILPPSHDWGVGDASWEMDDCIAAAGSREDMIKGKPLWDGSDVASFYSCCL